jgi:hypothetical protein
MHGIYNKSKLLHAGIVNVPPFSLIVSVKGFKLQPTKMKLTKSLHLARLEKKGM